VPRVGILSPAASETADTLTAFREGIRDLGNIEGNTIALDFRLSKGNMDALPALAGELVRIPVNVSRSTGCRRLKRQGNAARSRPDRDCRYVIFCNHASVAKRLPNKDLRTREHLTEAEVERLSEATKDNRYGHRDATMILVAYRHGLRAAELVELRWGAGRLPNRRPACP
jgi:integrase